VDDFKTRKFLNFVNEGVNCETYAQLKSFGFLAKSVDKGWDLLECLSWRSHEFEKGTL